jgi:FemAB-related protein (PEP-CTERM system-associated)
MTCPSPIDLPLNSAQRPVVRLLDKTPEESACWQAYVANAPASTIYHDIAWRDIFGSALGYRSYFLVAEAPRGRIKGALPLYLVPSLLGRPRLVSVPFRDRGGPLYDDAATFAALIERAKRLQLNLGASHIELKTIAPYQEKLVADAELARADHWVHSLALLTELDEAKLLKAIGDKTRNMLRQAERAGLRVTATDAGPEAIERWYCLYQSSQRGLGLPPFPRSFFERLLLNLGPRRLARVFEVRDAAGAVIAGCIILMDRKTAIYAYSASIPAGRHVRPNDLMLFRVMCSMIQEGCTHFDFGADSPDQSGLLFFKRKWLAKQTTIPRYYIGSAIPDMIDSSAPRYKLVRKAASWLPLAVARATLAPLVKYFG